MNPYSRITHAAVHLPVRRQRVTEIEQLLHRHSPALNLPAGFLRRAFGLHERAVADPGELPSDLAARAAARLLHTARLVPADIDLLLFAAVSADVREPANAHVVAAKTGLTCPAFDIGNACNSVINALQVADALIRTGQHRRVLITCGETLTRLSRWNLTRDQLRTGLTSLTGADLGAALLVESSPVPGITGSVFLANSAGWPAATLYDPHHAPGHPQGLHVDSEALLGSFVDLDVQAAQWLKEQRVDVRDLDLVCVHQPSVPFVEAFRTRMGIDTPQIIPTFAHTGNAAAATLPLQLAHAVGHRRLAPGDQVALFGLASGASAAMMLLRW
ncbi:3-oxoacyl-ACP synthase III family protein [Streptomyces sp. NPDC001513]|uniref:3-oxoacyl-ACP synthase III family protein n=1 Tax=Streptomyces sp. NPDC001513 TaxID=3364580 RepID=UPI00369C1ACA